MQPGKDKIWIINGESAAVEAAVEAELGDVNVPFRAVAGRGPIVVYSMKEKSGKQWLAVIDPASGHAVRREDLGTIPEGITAKVAYWHKTADAVVFFGNHGETGSVYLVDLVTGALRAVEVDALITDAVSGANGHLYLGTAASSRYDLREYSLPGLELVRHTPLDKLPAAVMRQGDEIVVLQAQRDLPSLGNLLLVLATRSIFALRTQYRGWLARYDQDLIQAAGLEDLGHCSIFWHPVLEVIAAFTTDYTDRLNRKEHRRPVLALIGPGGHYALMESVFVDPILTFDVSLNHLYFGGIEEKNIGIVEVNLADFSCRLVEQRGLFTKINNKWYTQGFKPLYRGGGGITYYLKPNKVTVLDFDQGTACEVRCDTGAPFADTLGFWLFGPLLREESDVVYIKARSEIVTYNNKAQKINIFSFPGGELARAIPFKARGVFLVDPDDGRHVLVRTPGEWRILELESGTLQPFLGEDGGRNKDLACLRLTPDARVLYILRDQVCYVVDPSGPTVLKTIALGDLKYDKEQTLCFTPRFSL